VLAGQTPDPADLKRYYSEQLNGAEKAWQNLHPTESQSRKRSIREGEAPAEPASRGEPGSAGASPSTSQTPAAEGQQEKKE
jgi:hypothetical protein